MMKKLLSFSLVLLAFLLLFSLAQAESAGTVLMVYLTGSNLAVGQQLVIPVRKTVADVIEEQNRKNANRVQLAAK